MLDIKPLFPSEIVLYQAYTDWQRQPDNKEYQHTVAFNIACNGEDPNDLFRPSFAVALMSLHHSEKITDDLLIWRTWLVWWTRAQQLKASAFEFQHSTSGAPKIVISAALANALYKAWYWTLEHDPARSGQYLTAATAAWDECKKLLAQPNHPVRTLIQIALTDESWFNAIIEREKNPLQL